MWTSWTRLSNAGVLTAGVGNLVACLLQPVVGLQSLYLGKPLSERFSALSFLVVWYWLLVLMKCVRHLWSGSMGVSACARVMVPTI